MKITHILERGVLDAHDPVPDDGPFTLATALDAGLTRRNLTDLAREGILRRPIRGIYVLTQAGDSLALRAACLRLVAPPDAVVVDRHAGWLLGADMVLAPGEHLALRPLSLYRPSGHGRLRNQICASGERMLSDRDVVELHGLRVTTALRTACDLGRVRWTDQAIAGMDALARLGTFSRNELIQEIERFRGHRFVTTARAVALLVDGRSESPGESVLRLRCHESHLRSMTPQVSVYDGDVFVARLDLADQAQMLAAEYDGLEWHSTATQLERDRRRREAVQDLGWIVKAFTSADVFGPQRVVDSVLAEARREARRRRGLNVWGT
ncbi:type IV toxin-antitoxin system AbiEi family antitoxin domain-containing protein [Nocardioides nanhaiensis]